MARRKKSSYDASWGFGDIQKSIEKDVKSFQKSSNDWNRTIKSDADSLWGSSPRKKSTSRTYNEPLIPSFNIPKRTTSSSSNQLSLADAPDWYKATVVIVVGIMMITVFYGSAISNWWAQNWLFILIISVLVAGGMIWFYINKIAPMKQLKNQEREKTINLEKGIIRKRLIKERAKALEGLTEEEQNHLLNKWVNEEFVKGKALSYSGSRTETPEGIPISSRLTSAQTANFVNAVGNRCENPTCRNTHPLEVHHIYPIAKGGDNRLKNLIVLCPTCHARYQNANYHLLKSWIHRPRRFPNYYAIDGWNQQVSNKGGE